MQYPEKLEISEYNLFNTPVKCSHYTLRNSQRKFACNQNDNNDDNFWYTES